MARDLRTPLHIYSLFLRANDSILVSLNLYPLSRETNCHSSSSCHLIDAGLDRPVVFLEVFRWFPIQ